MVITRAHTRTGAIAFSDIVGFTELTSDHGDDLALALIERHELLVMNALPSSARVVKQLGDGLLLFFEDAISAVESLLAMRDAAMDANVHGVPLWVRCGVHWGTPRVRGDDLIGHDVNVASRVSALAAPGEIIATESFIAQLDGQRSDFRSVGPVFVKGVSDPITIWRR